MKERIEEARKTLNKHWHEHSAGLTELADVVCILKDIELSVEAQTERLEFALRNLEELILSVKEPGEMPMATFLTKVRSLAERADLSVRNAVDRLRKCEIK